MFIYHNVDPVIFSISKLQVRWYGLMYLVGFFTGWMLGIYRASIHKTWSKSQVEELVIYVAIGTILGGRIGYIIFYGINAFWGDPLILFRIWEGGMSFHGGFIGVLLALKMYSYHYKKLFWVTVDFVAPLVAPGIFFGRIGNFINGELWGRETNLPWGIIFSKADLIPRHPSQLYEAFLEGIVLFIIVWIYSYKPRPMMAVSGYFAISYGILRIIAECFRQPDAHIGYIVKIFTMGQILSLPVILIGLLLLYLAYVRNRNTCIDNK